MSNIWPSSDLFELMESLYIIEISGKLVRLRPEFKDFVKGLDSQKVLRVVADMISEGIIPEPETKEMHRVYYFMAIMALWDSSLPDDETEAAAFFLSAFSWALDRGLLSVLNKVGIKY